eukprot:477938-Amphidinium_carterae.1
MHRKAIAEGRAKAVRTSDVCPQTVHAIIYVHVQDTRNNDTLLQGCAINDYSPRYCTAYLPPHHCKNRISSALLA